MQYFQEDAHRQFEKLMLEYQSVCIPAEKRLDELKQTGKQKIKKAGEF